LIFTPTKPEKILEQQIFTDERDDQFPDLDEPTRDESTGLVVLLVASPLLVICGVSLIARAIFY
jgi:hypothetical protein